MNAELLGLNIRAPQGWDGCNNGQASVCVVQTAAGESDKEDQSVPGDHLMAACHCFSPILQRPAPVWATTEIVFSTIK